MDRAAWWAAVHVIAKSRTRLSDFTFHFYALEKEMATHSSVLAWRIPGMGEPGRLLSMGSHRVGHDWSDLAAAAAAPTDDTVPWLLKFLSLAGGSGTVQGPLWTLGTVTSHSSGRFFSPDPSGFFIGMPWSALINKYISGPLCRLLRLILCIALLSLTVWAKNSGPLTFLGFPVQLRASARFQLGSLACTASGNFMKMKLKIVQSCLTLLWPHLRLFVTLPLFLLTELLF